MEEEEEEKAEEATRCIGANSIYSSRTRNSRSDVCLQSSPSLIKDNIISTTGDCLAKATIIFSGESAGLLNLVM